MSRSAKLIFAVVSALVLTACTADQIVGRYHEATCVSGTVSVPCSTLTPTAEASAVSIATPAAQPAGTGATFPERALAAYINVLANPKLSRSAKELRANLAANLKADDASGVRDQSVFHRTIIISVHKTGSFNPADRLEATDITITLGNARFDTWDTLATAYTTINAGTMQFTAARGLTEGLTVGAPSTAPLSATATLGGSQTDTRVENLTAAPQVETLSATISEDGKSLSIHRQGGFGVDLTGNTVIKADISYADGALYQPVFAVDKYEDKNKKPIAPSKLDVKVVTVAAVPPKNSISASVGLHYVMRHITSGDQTYEEKDDTVSEITADATPVQTTLISEREASPLKFGVYETAGPYADFFVTAQRTGYAKTNLCFDTYGAAADFLAYLVRQRKLGPSRVGPMQLGFYDPESNKLAALSDGDLDSLQVVPSCLSRG